MISPLFTVDDLYELNKHKMIKAKIAQCLGDLTGSEFFEIMGNNRKFSCYITKDTKWAVLYEGECIAYAYNAKKKQLRFVFSRYGIEWEKLFSLREIKCYGTKQPFER